MDGFNSLDLELKVYWFIAIPASLIFLIQTVMTFIGADATDGLDADFDGDVHATDQPFQLFSFRNLINFLLGFSWTGISFYSTISNRGFLILLSLAVGLLFLFLFFVIIRQIRKLAEDNSFQFANTLHKTAEVYLTIPENKSGKGKVLVSVNGSFHELEAMTNGEKIASGSAVKVVSIENNSILIVEKI